MRYLQNEWQRNERDRIQWDLERAEMKVRIYIQFVGGVFFLSEGVYWSSDLRIIDLGIGHVFFLSGRALSSV